MCNPHKPFYSLNQYYRDRFGGKVYKLSLNGGMTCPNRDGTIDNRGCIFCSAGGSGDFASTAMIFANESGRNIPDIPRQLAQAREKVAAKINVKDFAGYIAYFQAYTNTYADVSYLEQLFLQVIMQNDILGLSIGTRPDCLEQEKVDLLSSLNTEKPIFVELGLQTIHERTAQLIRRGYPLSVFEAAVSRLKAAGLPVIVHVILGLPGETKDDMLATCRYLGELGIDGIKLQLLHVLEGTDLAKLYLNEKSENCNNFSIMSLDEYASLVVSIIEQLPPEMVIHRITGDGPKRILLAPSWSGDKKKVLNTIMKEFVMRNTWQGKKYGNLLQDLQGRLRYFTLQEVLNTLISDGFITEESYHSSTHYTITDSGRETINFFKYKISSSIVSDINLFLSDNKYELKEAVNNISEYYKAPNGDYAVHCQVKENGHPIIDLTITVPDEQQADAMCGRWKDASPEIYEYIMTHLL